MDWIDLAHRERRPDFMNVEMKAGSNKMRGISRLIKDYITSLEGLCSMELKFYIII